MYKRLFFIFAALCVLAFAACGDVTDEDSSSSGDTSATNSANNSNPGNSTSSASSLPDSIFAFEGANFEAAELPKGDDLLSNVTATRSGSYHVSGTYCMNLYTTFDFTAPIIAYVSPAMVSSTGYNKFSFWIKKGSLFGSEPHPAAIAIGFGAGAPASDSPVFYLRNDIQESYSVGDWVISGSTWDFSATKFVGTTSISGNVDWEKLIIPFPPISNFNADGKKFRIHYGAAASGTRMDYYFDDFKFEL